MNCQVQAITYRSLSIQPRQVKNAFPALWQLPKEKFFCWPVCLKSSIADLFAGVSSNTQQQTFIYILGQFNYEQLETA